MISLFMVPDLGLLSVLMTDGPAATGTNLRLARQARGFSQQQLASMASLRVALAIAQALGLSVEELFGPGEPAALVQATSLAPLRPVVEGRGPDGRGTDRVTLAQVGERFVALPLRGDAGAGMGFLPADGLAAPAHRPAAAVAQAAAGPRSAGAGVITVRPIAPSRPTLVVAGCDPALPLLATRLALLDPPVAFAWWPCGSAAALRLARQGLVHAAGVHAGGLSTDGDGGEPLPDGAEVVGFAAWREGLAVRPGLKSAVTGLDSIARYGLRIVNREPGAEARRLLDAERERLGLAAADLPGYSTQATGHLQVASAVAAGLADAGVTSEPAALAYGLAFVPLAEEQFRLVIPAEHVASREVQSLLRVLSSPWLLAQLANLPGYDPTTCGDRPA
jgi:molybdate-binding protein